MAAAVLVVGAVVSLGGLALGISNFRVVTDSKALPPTMRSLVVDTGSVPVAVRITTDRDAREPRADLRMVNSTRAAAQTRCRSARIAPNPGSRSMASRRRS